MPSLYPLRFQPILKQYLWGGRRLGTVLGKPIGTGDDYAESWEISDHSSGQSVVAGGPLAGTSLHALVSERGAELLGRHHPQERFPLLFKFLDSQKVLSVQVHPNDAQAAKLTPPDLGKTEAWIVLDVQPGALVYAGMKRGFDREALAREVARGTTELCLHQFTPQVGDCIFIPARTVHALGAGLLIAEIQQASDTTYRLFDWNRVGPDGKPRTLHVAESLDTIDYAAGPVSPQVPLATDKPDVEQLVTCDKFIVDRWKLTGSQTVAADERCHLLVVLKGAVRVSGDPTNQPLRAGETMLVPACCLPVEVTADEPTTLLDIYLP